jgi:hypothetical protein
LRSHLCAARALAPRHTTATSSPAHHLFQTNSRCVNARDAASGHRRLDGVPATPSRSTAIALIRPFARASLLPQRQEVVFCFHFWRHDLRLFLPRAASRVDLAANLPNCRPDCFRDKWCARVDTSVQTLASVPAPLLHSDSVQRLRTVARLDRVPSWDASSSAGRW